MTGLGFSRGAASSVLLAAVACAAATAIVVGALTTRRPVVRVPLATAICTITILGWIAVIATPPGAVSRAFVVALICVMGCGGPISAIAFALARDYNRAAVVGTATGVVNVGGFAATILCSILIGMVLDVAGSSPRGFRLALIAMVGVQLFGAIQVGRWWLRARNFVLVEQCNGREVPVHVVRHRFDMS